MSEQPESSCGIVYCQRKVDCEAIAEQLQDRLNEMPSSGRWALEAPVNVSRAWCQPAPHAPFPTCATEIMGPCRYYNGIISYT